MICKLRLQQYLIVNPLMFRLEHVQEYTRALEESSDEEEDEEDDMPMTIKRPGEDSDKLSVIKHSMLFYVYCRSHNTPSVQTN